MEFYSPVFYASTETKYFEFSKYLFIEFIANSDFKLHHEYFLSSNDKYEISSTQNWFGINEKIPKYLSPSQALNILLLSFWTLSPTEIHLKYKLKSDDTVGLFLDRFLFNKYEERKTNYTINDFSEIKTYYTSFIKIFKTNKRLSLALDNTYRACTTYNWKVAFLLLTNALESIFTYSREKGITKRLAKSYACFMSTDKKRRDKLFREFYHLYNIRSEIVHGTYRIRRSKRHFKELSQISNIVRLIWQKILTNKIYLLEFEKKDNERELFLTQNFINNYSPPKITIKSG